MGKISFYILKDGTLFELRQANTSNNIIFNQVLNDMRLVCYFAQSYRLFCVYIVYIIKCVLNHALTN